MTATQIDLHLGFYPQGTNHLANDAEVEPGIRMGLHPEGLFAFAATPVHQLDQVSITGHPEDTANGIVCGDCTRRRRVTIRHASVAHVGACAVAELQAQADDAAEARAEAGWLRYAEGGWDTNGSYAADLWEEERRCA
jgi:hypothetical protein